MYRKLMIVILAIMAVCGFFFSGVIGETSEKMTTIQIPEDQRVPPLASTVMGGKGFCVIKSDSGIPDSYFGSFQAGDGFALYMDPAKCGLPDPYPFKVTDVHFQVFDFGCAWPVEMQVNIRDLIHKDKRNGPGDLLCSQIYSIPIDSAYPNVIHLDLDSLCCVYAPFFLEVIYTGQTSLPYASLVMSDSSLDYPDTCDAWVRYFLETQHWYFEWAEFWASPQPGCPILRITGYTQQCRPESCWYWKDSTENAPSGMPDFGQYQFGPPDSQAMCGPTAVANCLWWFGAVPPDINDPGDFIRLLSDYFRTDPASGTWVDSIRTGLEEYFLEYTFAFALQESIFEAPDFYKMEDSLKRSQDIILLLGFWQQDTLDQTWFRFGGHFVTMAGVCSDSEKVALSDPARDPAESQWPGRVPVQHPSHPPGDAFHNDPQYVSHDIYQAVIPSESPGGTWALPDYYLADEVVQFESQNFQPEQEYLPYLPGEPVFAEIEYAIMICPKHTAVGEEGEESAITPKDFELYQSYPNPFNNQTIIKYNLLKSCQVNLTISNILGQKVKTLVEGYQEAGPNTISWDGRDEKGKDLASGIYFYQLKVRRIHGTGDVTQTKRMVLLK